MAGSVFAESIGQSPDRINVRITNKSLGLGSIWTGLNLFGPTYLAISSFNDGNVSYLVSVQ